MIDFGFSFGDIDPALQSFQVIDFDLSCDDDGITLGDAVFGVSKSLREFTIVGKKDKTSARGIESTDWKQTALVWNEIDNAWATLWVTVCTKHAFGFIESKVNGSMFFQQFAVDGDGVAIWVDFGTDLGDCFAVDFDPTLFDEFIDLSS